MYSRTDIMLAGLNKALQVATPQGLSTIELCRDIMAIIAHRERQGANFDSRIILLMITIASLLLTKNPSTNLNTITDIVRPAIVKLLMEDMLNGLS